MEKPVVNFLEEQDKIVPKPKRRFTLISKSLLYLLIIFVILAVFFGIGVISSGENLSKTLGNVGLWDQLKRLVSSENKDLRGEDDDRINILLLGMGGAGHDGPLLTDTIIIGSVKPSTGEVAMISVPRDLMVQIPGYGFRRVNVANAFGEVDHVGQGAELAADVLSETFDIPIHYYVRLDFTGFEKIIDDLDGVDVQVENLLDDEQYPIPGKENATTTERYEHLYIEPGLVEMDGELALKYVRSRHAKGIEGSDFARSKRQQKVLLAVKDKGLNITTIINPVKISRVMDTVSQHLTTNLQVWEILRLFNMVKEVKEDQIIRRVFDDSPNGELEPFINTDGAFMLRPKDGSYSRLRLITQNIFDPQALQEIKPKQVEIMNGTKIPGLALRTSEYLESLGYLIISAKNAPTQDYTKTAVYDLADDVANTAAEEIAELLEIDIATVIPLWVNSTTSPAVNEKTDVLIILGQDRKDL
jgi:polyisoprenyl-teichoic acid--peptidoglycan teichoic acid transferase